MSSNNKKKKNNKRSRLIGKRVLQFGFLALMLAALGATAYVAVASTQLMRNRAEEAERKSEAASRRDSAAAGTYEMIVDDNVAENVTEATNPAAETPAPADEETRPEDPGWSFLDLFDPGLFTKPEDVNGDNYIQLADQYAGEKRIWMGDSRFVGITNTVPLQPTDVFISKGAMAYDWFSLEGVAMLTAELAADPHRIVIINFGVNDCANNCIGWRDYFAEDYVALINQLILTYPETKFCFASVGQVNGPYTASHGRKLPQDDVNLFVDMFNATMCAQCNAQYIDLSEFLARDGFATVDGVHFDAATNQKIYRYCVAKAGRAW